MTQSTKEHWNTIYQNKEPNQVSWFQEKPTISIDFINKLFIEKTASIIDVGGGDSLLVDYLLKAGYTNITVLDISEKAIAKAKNRLGSKADKVKWIVSDILDFKSEDHFDVWHDRAAFHFITSQKGIEKYIKGLDKYVTSNGSVILGTFSKTGPKKCSGIPITQYSEDSIKALFEPLFKKESCVEQDHLTPFDTLQNFIFCTLKKQ
ncbi:class I SAM-dependent methyltransferase [Croceibacter atlanticus]|uniref:class I SAM-dependent methyltransferase n=1 Tax=Croceibacter atlanticus TaxID=313588 RepID=UPI0024911FB7|nr:class I SAM-dependent methyltransferase [Croceibacter atlanticus]